jgi:hypothetical protein
MGPSRRIEQTTSTSDEDGSSRIRDRPPTTDRTGPPTARVRTGSGIFGEPGLGRAAGAVLVGAALLCNVASPIEGQTDSATVVPSARYGAGPTHQSLLGRDYRVLWTTPVRIEVLDLRRYAGGLTPTQRGGGRQTASLRFRGADDREYTFRSVDKWPALAQDPDLRGSVLGRLIEDQVSSLVPAAPLVAAPLAAAAGVLSARPHLFLMPDDPLLGAFRSEFAGMLGTLEERADEPEGGGPGFGGFSRIISTATLLERLEESPFHRVDSRAYLTARLVDVTLGDWDRHADQWRWGQEEHARGVRWIPIARDRDYSFANYDGSLLDLVRLAVPNAVRFDEQIAHLEGLVLNATSLDRRLLVDLPRSTWDSVAVAVQASLSDGAIEEALRRMPPEHQALAGAELARKLRHRRDRLGDAAARFYEHVALVPEIHATDVDEFAEVVRHADGSVEVSVMPSPPGAGDSSEPYFRRLFLPDETRQIRLYLHGGADRAVVRGAAGRGILVRVVGGGGRDVLIDSSTVAQPGRWTTFHDSGPGGRLEGGVQTRVDRRPHREAEAPRMGLIRIPPTDHGSRLGVAPSVGYSTTRGAVVGARLTYTRYGFRRSPYASRYSAVLRYSTRWSGFEFRGAADARLSEPSRRLAGELTVSAIDALRFYGFGNETPGDLPAELIQVRRDLVLASGRFEQTVGPATFSGGPVLQLSEPRLVAGSPLEAVRPLGAEQFGTLGAHAGVASTHGGAAARLQYEGRASAFPFAWNGAGAYGDLQGDVRATVPLLPPGNAWAVFRGSGRRVWGSFPFFEAAFLGGRQNLRGFPQWRFAGDAMVYGGAELGARIGRLPLIMNWSADPFVFLDAGRVFLEGEPSSRWHSAPGAGIALTAMGFTLRLTYAQGPAARVYLEASSAR